MTACLGRDDNAVKKHMRENHKSKHISSPTPFLFLPVRLSQSLAQVWPSGSSSLATPAWRSACRVHCHYSLMKLTPLFSSLLSQQRSPTRKALASSASCQLSDGWLGDHWALRRKLGAHDFGTCRGEECLPFITFTLSPRACISVIMFSFSCSGPHTQRYRQLLQLIFRLCVASRDLGLGRAHRKHLTSEETKSLWGGMTYPR